MFYVELDLEGITVPEDNTTLWRYMDFEKFVSILMRKALFFARVDKLGDPNEGAVPMSNIQSPNQNWSQVRQYRYVLARSTLVSSWHNNICESKKMWEKYSGEEGSGIAIKTTMERLKNSLTAIDNYKTHNKGFCIGNVSYINYLPKGDSLPNKLIAPFFHKKTCFNYEKETRIITLKFKKGKLDPDPDENSHPYLKEWIGNFYQVNISELIQEVIITPFAPFVCFDFIKKFVSNYLPKTPVRRSKFTDKG